MKKIIASVALIACIAAAGMVGAAEAPARGKGALSQLPPEKASMVKNALKSAREKNSALRAQARGKQEELKVILTAPKFDRSAYLAKRREIAALREQMAISQDEAYAAALEKLSPEERKLLATRPRTNKKASERKP